MPLDRGGVILVIIAATMVLAGKPAGASGDRRALQSRPRCFRSRPPCLWNAAGIVALVTLSAEADSVGVLAMVLVLLAVVLALDVAVFRLANRVSDRWTRAACR
jgi:small neutral amino acid transporter SnatA (MarC family)